MAMKVKGVVLCGGEGKRLRPLTYYFQKTMIPIGPSQKPLLEYIIKFLRFHGIDDIILLVGYKSEQIRNYFEDGSRFNVKISYSEDPPDARGTGNALLNAYDNNLFEGTSHLLIYYGDILSNIDLKALLNHHMSRNAKATLAVSSRYQIPVGVVEAEEDRIIKMIEKPWLNIYATIGILALSIDVMDILASIRSKYRELDIMGHFIPELVDRGLYVSKYLHDGFWYDVGSTEKYEKLDNSIIYEVFKDIL